MCYFIQLQSSKLNGKHRPGLQMFLVESMSPQQPHTLGILGPIKAEKQLIRQHDVEYEKKAAPKIL